MSEQSAAEPVHQRDPDVGETRLAPAGAFAIRRAIAPCAGQNHRLAISMDQR
jgi:hypothetical protein